MSNINQKIIDAVIAKAEKVCPDSLALIGIYGSVSTGDEYEKSDLDLLILIDDDEGWKLGTGFILNDSGIGYDIYCTNQEGLKFDAECHHAQISKLMDSMIVYIKNQEAYNELCRLREQTKNFLKSDKRFQRVDELMEKAKVAYADACLHKEVGKVRLDASMVVYYLLNAIMIYHGTYFKRGIKRTFDEMSELPVREDFLNNIKKVALCKEIEELRDLLKNIILYVENCVHQDLQKEEPSKKLSGTYEEMYSNWRNKVEEASLNNDSFSSFMNMCSLQNMFSDIASVVNIGNYDIMGEYNPDCLEDNIRVFDRNLERFEDIYKKAGIKVKRFSDVDEFIAEYLETI